MKPQLLPLCQLEHFFYFENRACTQSGQVSFSKKVAIYENWQTLGHTDRPFIREIADQKSMRFHVLKLRTGQGYSAVSAFFDH